MARLCLQVHGVLGLEAARWDTRDKGRSLPVHGACLVDDAWRKAASWSEEGVFLPLRREMSGRYSFDLSLQSQPGSAGLEMVCTGHFCDDQCPVAECIHLTCAPGNIHVYLF